MSVYVDNMFATIQTKLWPFSSACHMYADTTEELHKLAIAIGLRLDWFQKGNDLPHYDLTVGKRATAISCGALPRSHEHVVSFIRVNREIRMADVCKTII